MITTIFLHIGLHKTGTSTIQHSFGEISQYMAENGILIPYVKLPGRDLFNYSTPMVSMFCSEPHKYPINIKMGIHTKEAAELQNKRFDEELQAQIRRFEGHTMLISGEGISGLNNTQLERLRDYLIRITNPQVKIKVLMVIRHPVKWAASRLLEQVKSGKSLQSVLPETTGFRVHHFISHANKFRKIFGEDMLEVQRFEDLAENPGGFFAGFVESFKILEAPLPSIENKHINQAYSYECTLLLSEIYRHFPFYLSPELYGLLKRFNPNLIYGLPGVKFHLSEAVCHRVWEKYAAEINDFCRTFRLPEYQYSSDIIDNDKEKWSEASTRYLASVIEKLPAEIVPVILRALLTELKIYHSIWPWRKKLRIFALIMFYSKYFQTTSLLRKAYIVISTAGLFNGMVLLPGYFVFKSRLNRRSKAEQEAMLNPEQH
jgi:hypothetical protein